MKKIVKLCLLLPLLLASCSSKPTVAPPSDLIGKDTIVQIITDQLIIESTIFNAPPQYDKDALARALYPQLFEKYNVTIPRYRSSLTYYFADKDRMDEIMMRAKEQIDAQCAALPTQ